MPNQPRPDNPHRSVRVEDDLWRRLGAVAAANGTDRAKVINECIRQYVEANTLR